MRAVLTRRAVNRATLARQLLLDRAQLPTLAAVSHLVGLQAQTPQSWYLGLWSRLAGFDPVAVGALLERRELVRVPAMRSTLHLLTAEDALALRPLTQPAIDRSTAGGFGRHLEGVDRDALVASARTLVEEQPRTAAELGRLLLAYFPGRDPGALAQAARAWLPMVQVPPRGVWQRSGQARQAPLDAWLGRPLAEIVVAPPATGDAHRSIRAAGPLPATLSQVLGAATRRASKTKRGSIDPAGEVDDDEVSATYDHAAHAASFGAAAEAYDRGRPKYPSEALDWLLPPDARQVLDLGAGTGKLTGDLVERGLDVIAVEPSQPMLDRLCAAVPGARALAGAAEQIPLAGSSVDAVLLAQAWHWVDPVRAVPEIARVLRPGGRLGLVWNLHQDDSGWSAALSELLEERTDNRDGSLDLDGLSIGEPFGPLEHHEVAWTHHLSHDQVVDTVSSRSYVITLSAPARHDLLDQVRHLLETHPDLDGAEQVAMPYLTRCYRLQQS